MKFKINRDDFSNGLQQVLNIVSTRSTMPILGNVLIEAKDDRICLSTTNLDLGIRSCIKASVDNEGEITLPVRRLAMIIRELPKVEVFVEASSNNQAQIESGGSHFRIMGISKDEFPSLSTLSDPREFLLPQNELVQMLRSVSYAQSTDENRHMLNGVCFNITEGKLVLVATDGRRLAFISSELKESKNKNGSLILPAKTVTELERLLGQGDNVRVVFNERQIAFNIEVNKKGDTTTGLTDDIYLISKIVEGDYPDFQEAIPKQTKYRIKLERELMLECMNRAALMTSDKKNSVKIKISKNLMEIFAFSPEHGDSHESMAIQYEDEDVELSFNPWFIIELLKALPNDEVIFEFKDNMSAGVFKTNANFLCVIMPLVLN